LFAIPGTRPTRPGYAAPCVPDHAFSLTVRREAPRCCVKRRETPRYEAVASRFVGWLSLSNFAATWAVTATVRREAMGGFSRYRRSSPSVAAKFDLSRLAKCPLAVFL